MESISSQKLNENLRPAIGKYLNVSEYLIDYYKYRKNTDAKFSYEIWASELGFKSKSSVRLVCNGHKFISNLFIEAFSQNEKLTVNETEQFKLLANYRNCDDPSLKKTFLNRIIEMTDLTGNEVAVSDYMEFLSSVSLPVIQLIISFPDFIASAKSIQTITQLELDQIEESLLKLQNLGLIEPYFTEIHKEQLWKSCIKHFRITSTLKKEAINCFHHETTKEIAAALKLETALKKFRSIYFSLSDQTYTELSEDIEQFVTKLVNKYGNDYLQEKSLFKVNVQAYPVTDKLTGFLDGKPKS
jgi:uncharacterized protein (TIGR02147 family)